MARKKKYDEGEVLEKALVLFWSKGYEPTSTRMLEKQMGINQFSIYASFGNKEGVFKECVKLYQQKIKVIIAKLQMSENPVEGIKQYFYDFLEFSNNEGVSNGCLITNTINELGVDNETSIIKEAVKFTQFIRGLFLDNLKLDTHKDQKTLNEQADYLIVSMSSLATSSKIFTKELLNVYIEYTFKSL